MASFDEVKLEDILHGSFATFNPNTGANKDADSLPTLIVYEEGSSTALTTTNTVTNITTGRYRWQVTIAAAAGFEVGKFYEVWISATVTGTDTVAQVAPVCSFKCTTRVADEGVNVTLINSDTVPAANLALSASAICTGTVDTGASTTSIPTSAFSPSVSAVTANQLVGRIVIFRRDTTTVALRGQATDITASTNAVTPTLTVTALTATPDPGDVFIIV